MAKQPSLSDVFATTIHSNVAEACLTQDEELTILYLGRGRIITTAQFCGYAMNFANLYYQVDENMGHLTLCPEGEPGGPVRVEAPQPADMAFKPCHAHQVEIPALVFIRGRLDAPQAVTPNAIATGIVHWYLRYAALLQRNYNIVALYQNPLAQGGCVEESRNYERDLF